MSMGYFSDTTTKKFLVVRSVYCKYLWGYIRDTVQTQTD